MNEPGSSGIAWLGDAGDAGELSTGLWGTAATLAVPLNDRGLLLADGLFETILVRPDGPAEAPPLPGITYLRQAPAEALASLKADRWTAYIGATHEDEHDLAACLHALRAGAGWVGMIGAKSRAEGRLAALRALGASEQDLSRLRLGPGIAGLGKAPWEVAVGIMAEVMQALNPAAERA